MSSLAFVEIKGAFGAGGKRETWIRLSDHHKEDFWILSRTKIKEKGENSRAKSLMHHQTRHIESGALSREPTKSSVAQTPPKVIKAYIWVMYS